MASTSVTPTELEVEMHDDTDVYQEHGEEEVLTCDEYVEVETHMDEDVRNPCERQGSETDKLETCPMGTLQEELKSDDDQKGAHKVGNNHHDLICCTMVFNLNR